MPELLYVEDDDVLRGLYAECLREAGFNVHEVRLAEEGLEAVRREPPDLVLLDISMPRGEMSGIEALARLREQHASVVTPIVLLSGIGNILNPELVKSLRVAAVVPKPAQVDHLVEILTRVLETASS